MANLRFCKGLCLGRTSGIKAPEDGRRRVEEYIKSGENQWAAAEVSLDYRVAERILADSFVGVAPVGTHYKNQGRSVRFHL